jgi:hypothetical protein
VSKNKVSSKDADMIIVAKDVSSGITKFSGFKPLRKVRIAIPKDTRTIPTTAITLDTPIIAITSTKVVSDETRFIAKDPNANMTKIENDASQALVMFLAWLCIELKLGLSKPKASLVFAVEPTTEPTLLMLLIKAGYAVSKAG